MINISWKSPHFREMTINFSNESSRENDEEYKDYNNYDEGDYDNDDYDEESNDNEEKRDNKTIDTSINKAN